MSGSKLRDPSTGPGRAVGNKFSVVRTEFQTLRKEFRNFRGKIESLMKLCWFQLSKVLILSKIIVGFNNAEEIIVCLPVQKMVFQKTKPEIFVVFFLDSFKFFPAGGIPVLPGYLQVH